MTELTGYPMAAVPVILAIYGIGMTTGAFLGSVVLEAGYGYEWPSRVGVLLALAGMGIAAVSVLVGRHRSVL